MLLLLLLVLLVLTLMLVQGAMAWAAENLGLIQNQGRPRTGHVKDLYGVGWVRGWPDKRTPFPLPLYPPPTLRAAVEGSLSRGVQLLYNLAAVKPIHCWYIDYELGTWPHGQLFAAGRSGRYYENLLRYLDAGFDREALTVVELESELSAALDETLKRVGLALERGMHAHERPKEPHPDDERDKANAQLRAPSLDRIREWRASIAAEHAEHAEQEHVANQSAPLAGGLDPDADPTIRRDLAQWFRPANEQLFALLGRRFEHWHARPWYDEAEQHLHPDAAPEFSFPEVFVAPPPW